MMQSIAKTKTRGREFTWRNHHDIAVTAFTFRMVRAGRCPVLPAARRALYLRIVPADPPALFDACLPFR